MIPVTDKPASVASPRWRRTTAYLSVGQLVSWGVLYYSFGVYLPQMHADLGWSVTTLSGGFAIATLTAGALAPSVGRWIDAHGSRNLMSGGTLMGIIGLLMWATATEVAVFYIAFALIGVAMATTLYAPAFATVIQHHASDSRRAIVTITLAGGLASTLFSPLAQMLSDEGSWRTGLLLLTIGFATVTLPLNLALPTGGPSATKAIDARTSLHESFARPAQLWLLAAIFTLSAGVSTAFSVHVVAFLIDEGHTATTAASIAGAAGLGKVGGRALVAAGPRSSASAVVRGCLIAQAGFLTLPLVSGHIAGSIVMVVMFGATSGALTIMRPLIVSELVGSRAFGRRNGEIQLATTVTKATTPVAAGLLVGVASYELTWLALALVVAAAAAITRALDRTGPDHRPSPQPTTPEEPQPR